MHEIDIRKIINKTDIEMIDLLNNTNPEAKDEFMESNEMPVPHNEYDISAIDSIKENIRLIEDACNTVKKSDGESLDRRLCLFLLNNNLLRNQLVYVDYLWRETKDSVKRKEIENQHNTINKQLFGEPRYDVFLSLLNDMIGDVSEWELTDEKKELYNDLMKMIGNIKKTEKALYRPSDEVFHLFSEYANAFLEPILSHIPSDKSVFKIDEASEIANVILTEEFDVGDSWRAIVEKGGATASVIPLQNLVKFPEKRSLGDYTLGDLKKIIAHEIGTHTLRSICFMDCPYQAFKTGLPGYTSFEEGLACAMEQVVEGRYRDCGRTHYISISLAFFLHKNFREIYEIQWRLQQLTDGLPKGKCYDSVNRTFRGTGRLTNHKDLAYYNGCMNLWRYVEKHLDDPELFDRLFLSGKTDPTLKEHEELLYEIKVGRR